MVREFAREEGAPVAGRSNKLGLPCAEGRRKPALRPRLVARRLVAAVEREHVAERRVVRGRLALLERRRHAAPLLLRETPAARALSGSLFTAMVRNTDQWPWRHAPAHVALTRCSLHRAVRQIPWSFKLSMLGLTGGQRPARIRYSPARQTPAAANPTLPSSPARTGTAKWNPPEAGLR